MIINTCGWVDNEGYKILLDSIKALSPTIIFVIGHEKLYSSLSADIPNVNELKLVKLPKSGGVCSFFFTF
jgi:polyribonucleotide 5'-hydroxyl-kinase